MMPYLYQHIITPCTIINIITGIHHATRQSRFLFLSLPRPSGLAWRAQRWSAWRRQCYRSSWARCTSGARSEGSRHRWQEQRGPTLCATQPSFFNAFHFFFACARRRTRVPVIGRENEHMCNNLECVCEEEGCFIYKKESIQTTTTTTSQPSTCVFGHLYS
jgi:hypothetical protein